MMTPAVPDAPDWTAIVTAIMAVLAFLLAFGSAVFSFLTWTLAYRAEQKRLRLSIQTNQLKVAYDGVKCICLNFQATSTQKQIYQFCELTERQVTLLTEKEMTKIRRLLSGFSTKNASTLTEANFKTLQLAMLATFMELQSQFTPPDFSFIKEDQPLNKHLKVK